MSSELLHAILITGLYSQLDHIKSIITPSCNIHTLTLNTNWEAGMSELEEPRETHIKEITFTYNTAGSSYSVQFKLMHGEYLHFTSLDIKVALDQVIMKFGWGKFNHLIPPSPPITVKPKSYLESIGDFFSNIFKSEPPHCSRTQHTLTPDCK